MVWRVLAADLFPTDGMAWLPLNFRRILLSIPWGFLHDCYTQKFIRHQMDGYPDSHVLVRLEAAGVILLLLYDLGLVQG